MGRRRKYSQPIQLPLKNFSLTFLIPQTLSNALEAFLTIKPLVVIASTISACYILMVNGGVVVGA
ncbi:MAG: hypothetical protein WBA93_05215 [Microcoleaceae cyanobacterium]